MTKEEFEFGEIVEIIYTDDTVGEHCRLYFGDKEVGFLHREKNGRKWKFTATAWREDKKFMISDSLRELKMTNRDLDKAKNKVLALLDEKGLMAKEILHDTQ